MFAIEISTDGWLFQSYKDAAIFVLIVHAVYIAWVVFGAFLTTHRQRYGGSMLLLLSGEF